MKIFTYKNLLLSLFALIGTALVGISYERKIGTQIISFNEAFGTSVMTPDINSQDANSADANGLGENTICVPTIAHTINLHPLRLLFGCIGGLALGFLTVRILKRDFEDYLNKEIHLRLPKNLIYILPFIVTTLVLFFVGYYIYTEVVTMTDDLKASIYPKYSFLLSLFISWLLFGRKIDSRKKIRRFVNKLLLGPFNWYKSKHLSQKQLQVIWITFLIICFLIFFPPWRAYPSSLAIPMFGYDDKPVFADFHFVSSSLFSVVGEEAPYECVEIDRKLQIILIGSVFILGLFLFIYYSFTKKDVINTQFKRGKTKE